MRAARDGVDGLLVIEEKPRPGQRVPLVRKEGYSVFRDGAGETRTPDSAVLHSQGWLNAKLD